MHCTILCDMHEVSHFGRRFALITLKNILKGVKRNEKKSFQNWNGTNFGKVKPSLFLRLPIVFHTIMHIKFFAGFHTRYGYLKTRFRKGAS